MNNDLIKRGLAISYAVSGLVRRIDGEEWIRTSDVRESLCDVPTAEPTFTVTFDEKQLQEIEDKAKAEVLASIERPQGEWIKVKEERMSVDMSGEIVTRYKCSECGRLIAILPSKLADYPFCHCGAEMKKGGAE